jgi:hypothetical protein
MTWWLAKSVGSEAKRSSRRCLTLVRVTTPTAARTPLPTKFAVAEKHIGDDLGVVEMIAQAWRGRRLAG